MQWRASGKVRRTSPVPSASLCRKILSVTSRWRMHARLEAHEGSLECAAAGRGQIPGRPDHPIQPRMLRLPAWRIERGMVPTAHPMRGWRAKSTATAVQRTRISAAVVAGRLNVATSFFTGTASDWAGIQVPSGETSAPASVTCSVLSSDGAVSRKQAALA
jgi:hypothetical protein